jgi:hypothetical protein
VRADAPVSAHRARLLDQRRRSTLPGMHSRVSMRIAVAAMLVALGAPTVSLAQTKSAAGATALAARRVQQLRTAAKVLKRLSTEAVPASLPKAKAAEVRKYHQWLARAQGRLATLGATWEQEVQRIKAACGQPAACAAKLEAANQQLGLQYLRLQNTLERENRSFTIVAAVMKATHDTAKNTINNLR